MNVIIPPYLEQFAIELYVHDDDVKALYNGKTMYFNELPVWAIDIITKALRDDTRAYLMLSAMHNTEDEDTLLKEFIKCRFGQFNYTPDLTEDGVMEPDPPICPKILSGCPGFGIICKVPGNLTRKEYIIVQNVVSGLNDAEIADKLNNSIATIRTHMGRVFKKLKIYNRAELLKFTSDNNIKAFPNA